jgi:hypothetical protein
MLKYWRYIVIVALCVYVVLLWTYALLGFPAEGQICEETKNAANQDCTTHHILVVVGWHFLRWLGHNLLELGTIALASFVLIQIIDNRKSDERQLRAYISIKKGNEFRQGGVKGLKFEFRPIIFNSGQTPAYDMYAVSFIKFMSLQEATTYDFNVPPLIATAIMTLGPREDRFTHVIFDRKLTRQELRQFRLLTHNFFIYGTIYYRDAFKRQRYTNYCYSIAWWGKRSSAIWHTGTYHNDSN